MTQFNISRPRPDVVRVFFPEQWAAEKESAAMFNNLLGVLDALEDEVTLLIVAGGQRPVYVEEGIKAAREILYHDNIKKIIIVADDPQPGVTHMSAFRGERGYPPIPMFGCETEAEAEQYL